MKTYVCKIHGETDYYSYQCGDRLRLFCKQCSRDRARRSDQNNPIKARARTKAWIENNRDRYLKTKKAYRSSHLSQSKEAIQRWKNAHPESLAVHSAKRKALKRDCDVNDFTPQQWTELLNEYDNKCAYCGADGIKLTQEHMMPLSRGGNHTKSNIVPACESCNFEKHTKTKEEYERIKKPIQPS